MATDNRPLSPHLQVYKPQLTSTLSITHRATGVLLSLGAFVLAWWITGIAAGPKCFGPVNDFLGSWIGQLGLFAWSVALYYHLCNGIRHLFWDMGVGLEIEGAYRGGYIVLAATAILTLLTWAIVLTGGAA